MDELLQGLLGPERYERTSQEANLQGLMNLGQALIRAGQGGQGGRVSTLAGLGMAAPAYMQGRQQAFDQTLQDILRQTQVQDLLRQRQEQEAAKRRQAQVQQMIPGIYRERMGQVPTVLPGETGDIQTTVPGVVGMQLDPERLRMLGMLGPEGMQAATQLAQFERSLTPERKTVTAKPGEQIVDPTTGQVIYQAPFEPKEQKIDTEKLDLGNKIVVVDKAQPGKILATYPKARDTAPEDTTQTELNVGKDFEKASGPYVGINIAYQKVMAAAKEPSAAGDLALIFNYMKILDPASVVRETEFANAQNATGVPEQIRNEYNRIKSGQRLNPEQRADFINQAKNIAMSQKDVFSKTIMPRYESIVATKNLNRANVLFDPFAGIDFNKPLEKPKAPSAANKPKLPSSDIDLINKYLKRGQ